MVEIIKISLLNQVKLCYRSNTVKKFKYLLSDSVLFFKVHLVHILLFMYAITYNKHTHKHKHHNETYEKFQRILIKFYSSIFLVLSLVFCYWFKQSNFFFFFKINTHSNIFVYSKFRARKRQKQNKKKIIFQRVFECTYRSIFLFFLLSLQ